MRKTLVVVVLALLTSGLYALPEFDYSSYTLPDYSVKGLEFQLPGFGFSAASYDGNPVQDYETTLDLSLDGYYFSEVYRQKWEFDYEIMGGLGYDYAKSEDGSYHYKDYGGGLNLDGRYYITGLLFASGSGSFRYEDSKENIDDSIRKSHRVSYSAGAGAGYGRLYNLTTMRRAQSVIDELYTAGLLTRYPNQADLAAFGDLLYELQVGRVLDSRLKRIEDYNRIDAFLNGKGLLKEENMAYFTILNDMLTYASIGSRSSGAEVHFLVRSVDTKSFDRIDGLYLSGVTNTEESGMIYMATAEVEKILNRYWQWSAFAGWQGYNSERMRTGEPDRERKMSNVRVASDLQWFPDTRTRVRLSGEAAYQAEKENINGTRILDVHLFVLNLGCDIDYYFSPHLGLTGGVSLRNLKTHDEMTGEDVSSVGTWMSLQLVYKVF
ncbi:MAG TPA: hypothetical protein PLF44_01035 [Candidatus Mcinerneyibacteriales bacterium]|nr:hypothetical protein [Candidatus Mcinerneyibacteriales bacterium]HPE19905.1 hypothetical protein [Candidatus Mcinerneyibacteriales bacterium]HPJ69443.1 hypothetical protein [Candidatus Mcinerneyibacteriales bacterium]HPQ88560.1 hypothetical protein [Candidatus Mcinerneyibacteriales bacterium]